MGATTVHTQQETPKKPSLWQGIILAAGLGSVAMVLGGWLPTVGGPVFAILLGILIRNTIGMNPVFQPGLAFASRKVLQWSIIALGFGLSITQVVQTGMESLWVTLVTMAAAFITAGVLGRILRVKDKLLTLIGVGTAICGGSAIAAVAPVIKPSDHETAYAISVIFLFNVAAVLVFPFFGHLMHMSDIGFGLWAGTAINDTSSVVAAAYSYSTEAGDYATVVKLTRATFIIPIALFYVFIEVKKQRDAGSNFSVKRLIPWFIVWFLVASAISSTGVLPAEVLNALQFLSKFMMVLALSAIGLSSNMRAMVKTGWQPVVLGFGVWMAVTFTSLGVQLYSGAW